MTTAERQTVSDRVGASIRAARKGRGWTQQDLAGRCAALGAPQLTRSVLFDLETGRAAADGTRRREVTVDDLTAIALALDVAPVHLLCPVTDDTPVGLTATVTVTAVDMRGWARGFQPLPAVDLRRFYGYVPEAEARRLGVFMAAQTAGAAMAAALGGDQP